MYLAVGLLLWDSIGKEKAFVNPNTVTVNIIKDGNEISIYLSHCSEGALRDE